MDNNCVLTFVVGVSGVGKTELIRRFVSKHHEYRHLEASKLIREGLNAKKSEQIRLLSKEQIIKNQSILLEGLFAYKQKCHLIILDGHLLINNSQELVRIPLDVVREIAPHKMILLTANPHSILSHCTNDIHRKRHSQTATEIEEIQNYLKHIAISYCEELGIRFDTLDFTEYKRFKDLLTQDG